MLIRSKKKSKITKAVPQLNSNHDLLTVHAVNIPLDLFQYSTPMQNFCVVNEKSLWLLFVFV